MKIFIPSPMPRKMTAIGQERDAGGGAEEFQQGPNGSFDAGQKSEQGAGDDADEQSEAEAGEDSDQTGEQVLDDPVEEPHFLGFLQDRAQGGEVERFAAR